MIMLSDEQKYIMLQFHSRINYFCQLYLEKPHSCDALLKWFESSEMFYYCCHL